MLHNGLGDRLHEGAEAVQRNLPRSALVPSVHEFGHSAILVEAIHAHAPARLRNGVCEAHKVAALRAGPKVLAQEFAALEIVRDRGSRDFGSALERLYGMPR